MSYSRRITVGAAREASSDDEASSNKKCTNPITITKPSQLPRPLRKKITTDVSLQRRRTRSSPPGVSPILKSKILGAKREPLSGVIIPPELEPSFRRGIKVQTGRIDRPIIKKTADLTRKHSRYRSVTCVGTPPSSHIWKPAFKKEKGIDQSIFSKKALFDADQEIWSCSFQENSGTEFSRTSFQEESVFFVCDYTEGSYQLLTEISKEQAVPIWFNKSCQNLTGYDLLSYASGILGFSVPTLLWESNMNTVKALSEIEARLDRRSRNTLSRRKPFLKASSDDKSDESISVQIGKLFCNLHAISFGHIRPY